MKATLYALIATLIINIGIPWCQKKFAPDTGESIEIESTENTENTEDMTEQEPGATMGYVEDNTSEEINNENIGSWEVEQNNWIEEANIIQANQEYHGNISSEEDEDYYKLTIANSGKINISFQHNKVDTTDVFWIVCLTDGNEEDDIVLIKSNGASAVEDSDAARIPAGDYYLKIYPYYHSDQEYAFTVNFIEEDGLYEKEKNDELSNANSININTSYIGNIETDKDVDYYKFSVNNKGKINISFEHDKIDSGDAFWTLSLLDGISDDTILQLESIGKEALLQSDWGRIPPGEYYLKIKPYYYLNTDYKFTINFVEEGDGVESEKNNDFDNANNISLGTNYVGNIQDNRDVDYYSFKIDKKRNINFTFSHDIFDSSNSYWEICIVDGLGDEEVLRITSTGKEGIKTEKIEKLPAGTYYIRVKPSSYSNVDYTILLE